MNSPARVSRPFPVGRWLLIPAAVMALMLLFDTSTLDFWFSDLFYVPGDGFVGRHSFFLEDILPTLPPSPDRHHAAESRTVKMNLAAG
mgnify:CR=1 FL=1